MDALMVDKKKYHKTCFCCEHCRGKLSLGNYISLHGHLFCPHHYKQLLKSKGHHENGLWLHPPTEHTRLSFLSQQQPEWRYSRSSISSTDRDKTFETEFATAIDANKQSTSKISVIWPPKSDPPKKTFQVEEDIQLTKPRWPPPENAPQSPKQQHRKAVPRSVL